MALAESPFRDPVEFLRKHLIDFKAGPGYVGRENIRVHSTKSSQKFSAKHGFFPLYDFRIGPVTLSNIFSQSNFTLGRSLRLGLLFTYTGDAYETQGLAKRKNSMFAGGFAGYSYLTLYAVSDIMRKKAGTLYYARYAPSLFKISGNELFAIVELEHMNRMYVDYYFGIRDWEGTAKIPAYAGKRSNNISGTILYVYSIGKKKNAEFLLWGGQKRYGKGVTNSPTVGLDKEYYAGIGWLFRII